MCCVCVCCFNCLIQVISSIFPDLICSDTLIALLLCIFNLKKWTVWSPHFWWNEEFYLQLKLCALNSVAFLVWLHKDKQLNLSITSSTQLSYSLSHNIKMMVTAASLHHRIWRGMSHTKVFCSSKSIYGKLSYILVETLCIDYLCKC